MNFIGTWHIYEMEMWDEDYFNMEIQAYLRIGAKGLGEAPMDGPAPAIANALLNAGIDIRAVPATPERLMEIMCDSS